VNGRSFRRLGILPNLIVAVVLLVLFDTGLHGWKLWFAAASIVLLTELILLAVALELRRRRRRGTG
jgi:hypothetical protein